MQHVLIMRLKKRVRLFEEGATMQQIYIHGVFATIKNSCADPGIFVTGGPGQSDQKKALTRFLFFFSPQLI